ncbi:MAG TPA: adenylosuccinate synthase [Thermoguttaceae bacterium]|nr:adenylosuccinate synthase [Thermoguttaceae bacterium]
MPATCVVGLQWGDEAKGKIVDLLTEQHDIVVRYQGGANAGHTVVAGGETYKLSLIPSGIFAPNVQCVVAGGVVLDPAGILEEIDGLIARGIKVAENLMLSDRAHVIFPWHFEEDRLIDKQCTSGEAIGTTMRGIGPCYCDKVGRSFAIRLGDMYRDNFHDRIGKIVEAKRQILTGLGGEDEVRLDADEICAQYDGYARRLKPHVADTTAYLLDAVEADKRVLFEGAQGSLLDIDHGTFPFVTSSNSSGVGVSSGSGVPGKYISKVVGILKAYTTRVGGGPFPTEQDNDTGQHIRDRGNEYGTVTKRPRRCGWFDAVATRYTARLSGVDVLAVMLLDVLSQLPELKICTAYELAGHRTKDFPSHVDDLRQVVPIYETLPGWQQEISDVRDYARLPQNARDYLDRLSELVGRPVEVVSVGPDRVQTIFKGPRPLAA